jgi:hypothetical protein
MFIWAPLHLDCVVVLRFVPGAWYWVPVKTILATSLSHYAKWHSQLGTIINEGNPEAN